MPRGVHEDYVDYEPPYDEYGYDEYDEAAEERRTGRRRAITVAAIGGLAAAAIFGGVVVAKNINDSTRRIAEPSAPAEPTPPSTPPTPPSTNPYATTSAPSTTASTEATTSEPAATTASNESTQPVPLPSPPPSPTPEMTTAAPPSQEFTLEPDQSRTIGSESFPVFSGYALNLFNSPETDAEPLNNPNADTSMQPHIAYSGNTASTIGAFCFVYGGVVQTSNGPESRWATVDASQYVDSGAVAASSGNVDYVSFAGLSGGAGQLPQCDPHDNAHNPAGM